MSLATQAEADLAATLEASSDFGQVIIVTDPTGATGTQTIRGQIGDIGQAIDTDTGLAVSGRLIHCVVRISALECAGFATLPEGIQDPGTPPWRVSFTTPGGALLTLKVKESRPDRTLGLLLLFCEPWKVSDT